MMKFKKSIRIEPKNEKIQRNENEEYTLQNIFKWKKNINKNRIN